MNKRDSAEDAPQAGLRLSLSGCRLLTDRLQIPHKSLSDCPQTAPRSTKTTCKTAPQTVRRPTHRPLQRLPPTDRQQTAQGSPRLARRPTHRAAHRLAHRPPTAYHSALSPYRKHALIILSKADNVVVQVCHMQCRGKYIHLIHSRCKQSVIPSVLTHWHEYNKGNSICNYPSRIQTLWQKQHNIWLADIIWNLISYK